MAMAGRRRGCGLWHVAGDTLVLAFGEKVSSVSLLAVVIRFNGGVTVVGQSECLAEDATLGHHGTTDFATRDAASGTDSASRLGPSSLLLLG